MLTRRQADDVWRSMFVSQVRAHYFARLANRYYRWKKMVTIATLVLSSIAGVLVSAGVLNQPLLVVLNMAVAVAAVVSIALGLDEQASKTSQLHYSWSELASGYEHLWQDWKEPKAQIVLDSLKQMDRQLSNQSSQTPFRKAIMKECHEYIWSHHPEAGKAIPVNG